MIGKLRDWARDLRKGARVSLDNQARLKKLERRLDLLLPTPDLENHMGRCAIVSCVTDNFIGLGAVWLASLVETKSIPKDCEVVLLTDTIYAPLSEKNRMVLREIYPKVQFHDLDTSFLSDDLVKRWTEGKQVKEKIDSSLPGKRSVYLKLSILRMSQFTAVLWMDSDMMVLRSIAGVFRLPADIAVVPVGSPSSFFGIDYGASKRGFNSGFMLVRERHLSMESFDKVVRMLNDKTHTSTQDQSLLNAMWLGEQKMFLPHVYNWKIHKGADHAFHDEALRSARVIHFVAQSKWELLSASDLPVHVAFRRLMTDHRVPAIITP
jgi:lipopolysaccharide biosynthesis glycosyltransferase